ncbi:hypothetical protein ACQEV9_18030 [Streptomyces chartreusis]|uniref:hypothetical protein n=1 Tax=Streptomyces chartreusis TaxID=1969 RepID=UPI003D8D7F36
MTAPTTPRIPTPGDLARRAPKSAAAPAQPAVLAPAAPARQTPAPERRVSAADAIAPGQLTSREHFRKYFLFGLRISRMHPHSRLVGHDLLWRASHATGRLAPRMWPSLEQLALDTGLTTGQVDVALANLHSRGWLHYQPPGGDTAATLAIPAAVLEQIRADVQRHRRSYSR